MLFVIFAKSDTGHVRLQVLSFLIKYLSDLHDKQSLTVGPKHPLQLGLHKSHTFVAFLYKNELKKKEIFLIKKKTFILPSSF